MNESLTLRPVTDFDEAINLDWEVPGMPSVYTDENADEFLARFEVFNDVALYADALDYFTENAELFYTAS